MQHKIHTGPEKGHFQVSHGDKRYLLESRKVQTGELGGHYQTKNGKRRYLLK